jgi:Ni/Co efflux regulator RcnB
MNRIVPSALALILAMPAAAAYAAPAVGVQLVQDRGRDRDQMRQPERHPQTPAPGPRPNVGARPNVGPGPNARPGPNVGPRPNMAPPPRTAQRFNWNTYRPGVRPPDQNRYRNFDVSPYQRNFRAARRYHWVPYARPPGWYYRRWVFGDIFPRSFWVSSYWITDYWQFGLMDPPYGYVWVRYGDDAVLVDVQSGRILRVVYSVFF